MKWTSFSAFLLVLFVACSDSSNSASDENIPDNVPFARTAPVIFTEVNPRNISFEDENGDKSDWIELYNPSENPVNLSGYSLSNSATEPHKWTFGNVTVPPYGFLIVFFSKKDRPDWIAPYDSTNMLGGGAWGWSDSQSKPIAGTSSAEPWQFSKYVATDNGIKKISGQLQFGLNEELGWSSACIFIGVNSGSPSDSYDLGSANQLLLTGYITKDEPLEVRLAQPDMDDWKGWAAEITGTGDSTTTYTIALPTGKIFPDLANIYGLRFSPVSNHYNLIQFTFSSIIARNQGNFPHTNFKLPQSGGNIFLFDTTGTLRDSIAYPNVPNGKSYAFTGNSWGFADPTPMSISSIAYAGQASDKFNLPASGFYTSPFTVSFASDSLSVVRCEVGGKAPTETSAVVAGDFPIQGTTVLRCATFSEGMLPSDVTTRTYIFETAPTIATAFITADPDQLFDPDSGIYEEGPNASAENPHFGANYWLDKTIPAEITFFEPGGASPAFSANVGYEIFGNYSRANAKKSFAIKFRKKYGPSTLEYKIFPEYPNLKMFKNLVFRNNGGNFYQDYIRDRLGSSITRGLDVDYQKARPAIVFYNGEYYGIHNIRERINENYFVTNYDYDENSIDLLNAGNEVSAGSAIDYIALENYMKENDMAKDSVYAYVASQMDIDNYTNYIQTEIFIKNQDWPGNNLKKWRSTAPLTKWKWVLYDLDFGFDNGHSKYSDIDMFHFITDETASSYPNGVEFTVPIRNLLKNTTFRNRFINRMSTLVASKFSADSILARIRLLMGEINAEVKRDQDRWNLNTNYMDSHLNRIETFAKSRPAEVLKEMQSFFELGTVQNVTITPNGCGTVSVDGIPLKNATTLELFAEVPVTLTAENGTGCTFSGWTDGETSAKRTITSADRDSYTANFR